MLPGRLYLKMKIETLILVTFLGLCWGSKVPVLLWSENRPMNDIPQVHAGSTLETSEFTQDYLSPLTSGKDGNLVIFVQEKLSLQDFTKYADVYNPYSDGGAFKNVRQLMDDHFSVHLPSVVSPVDALNQFKTKLNSKLHEIKQVQDLDGLEVDRKKPNLIMIFLTPLEGSQSDEEIFANYDKQIGEAVKRLNKHGIKYSAIYTAKSSIEGKSEKHPQSRRLLAEVDANNGTSLVNVSGCMFFYFRSVMVAVNKNDSSWKGAYENGNVTMDYDKSTCDNNTAVLSLTLGPYDGITMTLMFEIEAGNNSEWSVVNAETTLKGQSSNVTLDGTARMNVKELNVMAPRYFSYHCSNIGPVRNITTNETGVENDFNVTLSFDGFQLQAFDIQRDQFSDGWDCITFFTGPIWMGLTSSIILILILLYGFIMLADIRTMDKFDDAKGKTITVNVTD